VITLQVWDNVGGSGPTSVLVNRTAPSGAISEIFCFQGITPYPGGYLNRTWTCQPAFNRQSQNGTWTLSGITATDEAGNVQTYSSSQIQNIAWPQFIKVNALGSPIPPAPPKPGVPTTLIDLAFSPKLVDVKKADNPLQYQTVAVNCTTSLPPAGSTGTTCSLYFECANSVWVTETLSQTKTTASSFIQYGTITFYDWNVQTGSCTLQGVLTGYNTAAGAPVVQIYGTASPTVMARYADASAASALRTSHIGVILSAIALAALFLAQ